MSDKKEKAPWEMTSQERLEAAERKKEEGNLLFKDGKYLRAGKKYDKVVLCMISLRNLEAPCLLTSDSSIFL